MGQTASCRSQPGRSSGILNEQFPSLFSLQRWRLVDSGIRRFRHRIQHSQQSRGQNLPRVSSHPTPCLSRTSYFLFPQVWSFMASPALSQTGDGRIRPRPCPQEERTQEEPARLRTPEEGAQEGPIETSSGLWRVAGSSLGESAERELLHMCPKCPEARK